MHFDAVLVFVGLYIHVTELPRSTQFGDGWVTCSSVPLQNFGKNETYFLGQAEDPLLGSCRSRIWIMHSRSGKRGETVRERIPAF